MPKNLSETAKLLAEEMQIWPGIAKVLCQHIQITQISVPKGSANLLLSKGNDVQILILSLVAGLVVVGGVWMATRDTKPVDKQSDGNNPP